MWISRGALLIAWYLKEIETVSNTFFYVGIYGFLYIYINIFYIIWLHHKIAKSKAEKQLYVKGGDMLACLSKRKSHTVTKQMRNFHVGKLAKPVLSTKAYESGFGTESTKETY